MEKEMTFNDYQRGALEKAMYPKQYKTIYPAIRMKGEAREVADKIEKVLRASVVMYDSSGAIVLPKDKREELAKEVGDVLWCVATMAYDLGYTLEEIAVMNSVRN